MPAIPFLNNVDLKQNQLLNHRLHNTNTVADISTPADGQIAYESNGNRTRIWDDALSAWALIPRLDKTDTVTKRWNFSPDTVTTAPFQLGTNALTVLVTGLNADLTDGLHAATAATVSTLAARDSNARIKAADPLAADDVVTYGFLQGFVSGALTPKDACKVATTAALGANTRTGNVLTSTTNLAFPAVDGVTLVLNDRILVKNEATGANNGIYYLSQVGSGAAPWKLTRATDADEDVEMTHGVQVFITSGGTVNGLSGWLLTTPDPITLNTTALTFIQVSGTADITGGAGLVKTGNVLDVVGTTNRIIANADSIDISASYVGQTSITTLGTITTGTWSATTIGPTKGGTGQTTITTGDLLYGSASDTWSKLADVATGNALISGGVGVAPSWGKIGLATHISGTLGVTNGGTGANLSATGGTAQFVKQVTVGGAFTVGTISTSDIAVLFDNPTATTGLTAVNGSATTAMRSDAAPALNQSISPTWTGSHTFVGALVTLQLLTASSGGSELRFNKRGAAGDANASVLLGGQLGHYTFYGWNGTTYARAARITALASEDFTAIANGGNIQFFTTDIGATAEAERMRLTLGLSVGHAVSVSAGVVNVGTGFRISNAATTGQYLRANGTNFVSSALQVSDFSGTVGVANGGTGANLSATGGAGQYVKQSSAGGVFTVGTIGSADIVNATFVTSVTGTANRITSTGGLTPVIDISAAYVGQASITTLGTITTGTWNGTVVDPTHGGTGQPGVVTGDILYGSATNVWSRLVGPVVGNALISGGLNIAPSWGKIGLTTHVSGILGETNGGTAQSTYILGDTLYSDAANSLAKLAGNITATKKFLAQTGTGAVSAAPAWSAIVLGDLPAGLPKSFSVLIGNGVLTSIVVTHNLGSQAVVVGLRRVSDNVIVFADAAATTTNTVTINFTVAPTTNQYQAIVFAN